VVVNTTIYMNWGTTIVIALALFVTLIVSFGAYMMTRDTDSLVAADYYERGLNYDKLRNADSARTSVDSLQVKSDN